MYNSNQQLAMIQIGVMLAPYFTNEEDKIPQSMNDIVEAAEILNVTIDKGEDLITIRDKIKAAMTIYVNIDTDPDPDCYDGTAWVILILYPPCGDTCDLDVKNEDDERVEQLLIRMFRGERLMEGEVGVNRPICDGIEEYCAENNIIINKMGPRLANC